MDVARVPAAGGGSYSDAVVVTAGGVRWIHVAGQTPRPPMAADLGGQTEACFGQIAELLAGHGAGLQNLVQITVYLTDLSDYAAFAAVRGRLVGDGPPASAAVGVASLLDGALVEIAAVAAVPATR